MVNYHTQWRFTEGGIWRSGIFLEFKKSNSNLVELKFQLLKSIKRGMRGKRPLSFQAKIIGEEQCPFSQWVPDLFRVFFFINISDNHSLYLSSSFQISFPLHRDCYKIKFIFILTRFFHKYILWNNMLWL